MPDETSLILPETNLIVPPREWIIHNVLPRRIIALLVGPAGVSKTTAAIQWCSAITLGEDVFGRRTLQTEVVWVSCDRSQEEHEAHCYALGVHPRTFHFHDQMNELTSIERVVKGCSYAYPRAKLYFIDGFARLLPEGRINDYSAVAAFLCECAKWCQLYNITIIGCLHAGKVRQGQGYMDPRDMVCGTTGWIGFSNLTIVMQKVNPSDPSDLNRIIHVLSRAGAGDFSLRMVKSADPEAGGRLLPCVDPDEDLLSIVSMWILTQHPDRLIPKREIVQYAQDTITGMSERTIERWLAQQIEPGGLLIRPEKGKYKRRPSEALQEQPTAE